MGLENDEALESVLVHIRSVVLSSKGGVLLNHLQDDYRKFIGTSIPFEKFGYQNLESFLSNASDYVSVKKNSKGQLYADAVADSSTSHLSSLISKQKNSMKKGPKPKSLKENTCSICRGRLNDVTVCSNSSTTSKSTEERDQTNSSEIKELKMKLEKEMRITKGYSSEVERTNALLSKSEDSLRIERANVQKLKEQLKSLQVLTEEKSKKEEDINLLMREIKELNSKLEKEKKISRDFSSQLIRLNSLLRISQESLSAEQGTVKKLKSQIEALELSATKETSAVNEYLNSTSNSKEKCKSLLSLPGNVSWDDHLSLQKTDFEKQLNSSSNFSSSNDQQRSIEFYEKQMQKFQKQIHEQKQKLLLLEKIQQRHYTKLDNKIRECSEAMDIEYIIERLFEHPKFWEDRDCYTSDNNLCQSRLSVTPISGPSDNDSEMSFKAASVSPIAREIYVPPQVKSHRRNQR